MRFDRLDLVRYGIFTDHSLDLSSQGLDFHLVSGPNEAGKSTLRNAISELLFGIATKSPYDFLHGSKEMCLGAIVSHQGNNLEFLRRKARKLPLRDRDGNPLADDALSPFLSSADRAFFERMFGLDHSRLVRGGADILNAKDDVSRMLFEASAGLDSLGKFRERLEAEASSLWDKRKAKDRAYYKALAEYSDAKNELKNATVRAEAFRQVKQQVENANYALEEASESYQALETEQARLQRMRRVSPLLQSRKELLQRRQELGELIMLPDSASEQLARVQEEMARAQASIVRHQDLLVAVHTRLQSLVLDEALLSEDQAITELEELRVEVRKFPVDIEKRKSEVALKWQQVQRAASDLGWAARDEEAIAECLPSKVLRAELAKWARAHEGLLAKREGASRTLSNRVEEASARAQELRSLAVVDAPLAMRQALEQARALGNVDAQRQQRLQKVQQALEARDNCLMRLRPWTGELTVLADMQLPSDESIREGQAHKAQLRARLEAAQRTLSQTQTELEQQSAKVQQMQRRHAVVTLEELAERRRSRDALWSQMRAGQVPLVTRGDEYEEAVHKADELSDRRYQDAAQVKELEQLVDSVELLQIKQDSQRRDAELAQDELQNAEKALSERLSHLGLFAMDEGNLIGWCHHRVEALAADREAETARKELNDFELQVERVVRELAETLEHDQIQEGSLSSLVAIAEDHVEEARTLAARRQQLLRQSEQDQTVLESLRAVAADAEQVVAQWEAHWKELLEACHLKGDVSSAGAEAALNIFQDISGALEDMESLRKSRIASMERDLGRFSESARQLATKIAPSLAEEAPDIVSRELFTKLQEAQAAQKEMQAAKREAAGHEKQLEEAKAALAEAKLRLGPLLSAASVTEVEALAVAIERSNEARQLDKALSECTKSILDSGDGLSLHELEQEIAELDVSALPALVAQNDEERKQAIETRDTCLLAKKEAERKRDAICGQADAATAAARAEEALSEMAGSIERYIKVYIGARLLRWSIDRYREEKQDPLLARASEMFAKLTLGSFERLSVDFDSQPPQLLGQRPNGKDVHVDGMSEATRDQLFLALRLAAVELHLQRGLPLPFVADDLFINYDDERAQAGFLVLAELAQHTQVIYLTHHAHLVPLAESAIGPKLRVHHLER